MKIKCLLKRILKRKASGDVSINIKDQHIIEAFTGNPDNTFLVSFPRTGSHWLRMLMELYFERPSLVRVFYYPERKDYLTLHTHDLELDVVRTHVIYLYRNPVDTIYSQLRYHKEDTDDRERIIYWSDLYGRHLDKWLHRERFTTHKTVVTYEGLKQDLTTEFAKITQHFGQSLDEARLEEAVKQVTKDNVKQKVKDDPQVIQMGDEYEKQRQRFRADFSDLVWQVLLNDREYLRLDFTD